MALLDLGELDRAKKYMTEVYEQRRIKLGKEHPWTLWALCNLAKVHTELRLFDQAEDMLVGGIAAAERSLGEDHLGVLMGVGELARVYARHNKIEKAEDLMKDLIPRLENSRGVDHPDTLYALSKKAQLYEMQNKFEEAIEACSLAGERAQTKLTKKHPLTQDILLQIESLNEKAEQSNTAQHLVQATLPERSEAMRHRRVSHETGRINTW